MSDPKTFFDHWLRATALDPSLARERRVDWERQPPPWKRFPGSDVLDLPPPSPPDRIGTGLGSALARRRSRRGFGPEPLNAQQLADLLWACQGVTARTGHHLLRTAPSAGALYPFETYVSVQNVTDLPACLAHLNVADFTLELLERGDHGPHLGRAALDQSFVAAASAVLLWTAVLPRCAWKYGERAVRYLGLDIGHVAQNLVLACEALALACCPVAAFWDRDMNHILSVDGETEFAYYLAAVGPRADRRVDGGP